ncbi:MAG: hypothetical protein Q9160_004909 [Pyrenula sp. 1 TL-2023]
MDTRSTTGKSNYEDAQTIVSKYTCNFLSLPLEIRGMIYELIVSDQRLPYNERLKTLARLLRTSEQIYWDTTPYLYADESLYLSTTFIGTKFEIPSRQAQFGIYDPSTLSHIRCLQLDICIAPSARAQDLLTWINTFVRHCPALRILYIRGGININEVLQQVLLGLLTISRQRTLRMGLKVIAACLNRSSGVDRWPRYLSEDDIGSTYKDTCTDIVQHGNLQNITIMLGVKYSDWIALEHFRLGGWAFDRPYNNFRLKASYQHIGLNWEKMSEEDDGADQPSQSLPAND